MKKAELQRFQSVHAQDLHIHTTFSKGDSAVVPEQTVELIAGIGYADVLGISDHLEHVIDDFSAYARAVRSHRLKLGAEVNGAEWVKEAAALELDYYIYHCRDRKKDYLGAERLLGTGKPVIIAHPLVLETNLRLVPEGCLIEINNRYIWRFNWASGLRNFAASFPFVINSDAHQPHWLNQNMARYIAGQLGITETLLFS